MRCRLQRQGGCRPHGGWVRCGLVRLWTRQCATSKAFAANPVMTRVRRFAVFLFCLVSRGLWAGGVLMGAAHAQEVPVVVEGQRLTTSVALGGVDLRLNGTGVRAAGWFKGYVAALYLSTPASTADQALALPGPKRLQLRLLHDVPAQEFSKALRKGVARNSSESEAARLEPALARFEAQINALKKVRKADVVDIDQDAAGSFVFSVNGTLRSQTPAGAPLFAAVLRAFVGDQPYDVKLKMGLLGGPR